MCIRRSRPTSVRLQIQLSTTMISSLALFVLHFDFVRLGDLRLGPCPLDVGCQTLVVYHLHTVSSFVALP